MAPYITCERNHTFSLDMSTKVNNADLSVLFHYSFPLSFTVLGEFKLSSRNVSEFFRIFHELPPKTAAVILFILLYFGISTDLGVSILLLVMSCRVFPMLSSLLFLRFVTVMVGLPNRV